MKLSVIIVNYNVKHFLQLCLHAVYRAVQHIAAEVIVVDNNSHDGSVQMVQQLFPQTILIANKNNLGFSKANNQAVALANGEFILFLNPDTVMPEDFFSRLLPFIEARPNVGAIGPKLIDGRGRFAPDGKKSFPTLSVALYKSLGLNRIFPKSPVFNKYYAVHVSESQTAPVDVLSGCCMLVRSNLIRQIGGAFDEAYFMYCEDVDLCFRIKQAGFDNIYFPDATLIHYKGESTRKTTVSYVRIFNKALATFVSKHYGRGHARLLLLFIHAGIALRTVLGFIKGLLQLLRMPLLDGILLFFVLWLLKGFWVEEIKDMSPIPIRDVLLTFPAYVILWISSLYLNGAYDSPYRGLRVVRGMAIGTVLVLAFYGLLPVYLRHSRSMLLFSGAGGALLLVMIHELLIRLGIVPLATQRATTKRAVIVATHSAFLDAESLLQTIRQAPEVLGRIAPEYNPSSKPLSQINDLPAFAKTAAIDEIIFCVASLSYQDIFKQMQACGPGFEYKIHVPDSLSFVGSNSSETAGDSYAAEQHYPIAQFAQQRNKRMVDLVLAVAILIASPLLWPFLKERKCLFQNLVKVLAGRYTWIGYNDEQRISLRLPKLKPAILPPWQLQVDYAPNPHAQEQLSIHYARGYHPSGDIRLILKNLHFIGIRPRKDLAK